MIAFAKNNGGELPDDEGRKTRELQQSVFTVDKEMIAMQSRMDALLSEELEERVRARCLQENKPFILPSYYYPIFLLGWMRTSETTADSAVQQCENSKEPENLIVTFSVYKSLLQEYGTKLLALRKIWMRRKEARSLPKVDEQELKDAEKAYDDFTKAFPPEHLMNCPNAAEQRRMLADWVLLLRDKVWKKIETAAIPVRQAGGEVMKITYEEIQRNQEK